MKYIVSLVFTKVSMPQVNPLALNGSKPVLPDIDLQNFLSVCDATDAEHAYNLCSSKARLQFPDYKIAVRVVVEANAADLGIEE